MVPIGGVFLVVMGAALVMGAAFPRWRLRSIAIGALLGTIAAACSAPYFVTPPPPTVGQLASLAVAVALEVIAFAVLMPRLYRTSERAVIAGTLVIVGSHFLIMLPAFGELFGALAILCVLNGCAVWLFNRYALGAAWLVDGLLKLVIGTSMVFAPVALISG